VTARDVAGSVRNILQRTACRRIATTPWPPTAAGGELLELPNGSGEPTSMHWPTVGRADESVAREAAGYLLGVGLAG